MNDPIITSGQIEVYTRISDLYAKKTFDVVQTLTVNSLFGTNLMDSYVISSYHMELQLKLLRSWPIAILSAEASKKLAIAAVSSREEEERHDSNQIRGSDINNKVKLRVAKQTSFNQQSRQVVLVESTGRGLIYFK